MPASPSYRRLAIFFMILFLGVSGTLVYWQIARASDVAATGYNPRHCVQENVPARGTIYDRNGVRLAWSEPDRSAPCGWRRHYAAKDIPQLETLGPLLGYYDPTGYGVTGLELTYNDILNGTTTAQSPTGIRNGIQQTISELQHQQTYGNDVYLTIDVRTQEEVVGTLADEANQRAFCLAANLINPNDPRASVIVTDPHSGEILAMVSRPGYNADILVDHTFATDGATNDQGYPLTVGQEYYQSLLKNPYKPLINRPTQTLAVPGSTFKTLTYIAALDSAAYTVNSQFSEDEARAFNAGGLDITASNIGPNFHDFPIDVPTAYGFSDNVVFARMAVGTGLDKWLDYTTRFGISHDTTISTLDFDVPVVKSWVYRPGVPFDTAAFASAGYGQATLQISPLVMSTIVSSVAADGVLYPPHLKYKEVLHGVDAHSVTPTTAEFVSKGKRVMSVTTSHGVLTGLRRVIEMGFGDVFLDPSLFGGKTGTGQVDNSPYSESWFIGASPVDKTNFSGNPPKITSVIQREQGGEAFCQIYYSLNLTKNAVNIFTSPNR